MNSEIGKGCEVRCDLCNTDYTQSEEKGGFLFAGYAICPKCALGHMQTIIKHKEEKEIQGYCDKDQTFKQAVLQWRRGVRVIIHPSPYDNTPTNN
jgi:hypothetical protein